MEPLEGAYAKSLATTPARAQSRRIRAPRRATLSTWRVARRPPEESSPIPTAGRRPRRSPPTSTAARPGRCRRSESTSSSASARVRASTTPTAAAGTGTATATAASSTSATATRGSSAALREALEHLDVGNHHLISGWRARLAEQLAASTDDALPYAVFTPSGTEAVDLALRLARARTGREGIVATLGAYHGLAGFGWAASDPRWFEPFGFTLPGFAHVPYNDARGDARGGRARHRGGDPRVDPGDARLPAAGTRLPGGGRRRGPEHGRAADPRRGPDRPRPNRHPLVLPAGGHRARHADHRQGPRRAASTRSAPPWSAPSSRSSSTTTRSPTSRPSAAPSSAARSPAPCWTRSPSPSSSPACRSSASASRPGFAGLPFELRRRGLTMGLRFEEEAGGVSPRSADRRRRLRRLRRARSSVTQFKPPLILSDEQADEIIEVVGEALT